MKRLRILKFLAMSILVSLGLTNTILAQRKKTPVGSSKQAKPEDARLIKDRRLLVRQFEINRLKFFTDWVKVYQALPTSRVSFGFWIAPGSS